ncbi:MAG TPA: penicillin-binding protein activator [Thermoanaerobaculia bacterium]|nr:penicillin-binding protein activator [Thermoanaerobaculia bacterium]
MTDERRYVHPLLALLVAAGALGCPGQAIRFGAVLPLSGHAEVYGQAIRKGIEVAYQQAQKDPAFAQLQLEFVDSASDPERAKTELRKIYKGGAIAAIGGVTSAEALAMVKVADDEGRVLLSPSASLPQLTGISENFFRIFPSDFSEGTVMARYAYDNLRLRAGVILAKEETYAMGIQKIFGDEFQRKGGRILETIEYPANTAEFAALADRAVTLKPDFAYVAAYAAEISQMIQDLRAQGFAGLILTTSSFAAAETIQRTGAAAESAYFTQATFETEGKKITPEVQVFVEAFRTRFGTAPDLYAAHGYDAFNVLVEAYRQGGTTALSFWKGMRNIRELRGVTGVLQFDEKGDVTKFPHVYIVTQGKPVDVEERRQEEILRARQEIERIQREMERLRNSGS